MEKNLPKHIALIMDGNRRWAKERNLDIKQGHYAGAENLEKIALYANKIGIKYMTVYAFSTENWKRSEAEVKGLMLLLKAYVEKMLDSGKDVILEIEIQGALKIKEQFPQTLLLFVTPPSAEILKERLTGRGTETEEVIQSRLSRAVEEADGCEVYDYLVVNDELDEAVENVHEIICSERQRMQHNLDSIETIKNDLKQFVKGDLS